MLKGCEIAGLLLIALASFVSAESPVQSGGASLPRQAQLVNGVLVPVPDEIFRTLDTFHDSNWSAVLRPNLSVLQPAGNSTRIALSLGLVIGEGFIAIAAKDADEMQDLGKTAVKLARALGVEKTMIRREKSIVDHVERKEWVEARQEWSKISADLKEAMIEIKSEPVSQLVSLGGWLRGIDALSALTLQHYSVANARLMYQPVLLDSLGERLAKMGGKFAEDPLVAEMKQGVIQLRPLIGSEHGPVITEVEVRKIRRISTDLVKSIRATAN